MSLRVDTSVELAWAIANAEANMAGDTHIRPQHFYLGMLKVVDPSFLSGASKLGISEDDQKKLELLAHEVRHYLEMSSEQVTSLRRALRRQVRGDNRPQNRGAVLHRSDESREMFRVAFEKASSTNAVAVSLPHLAEALFEGGHASVDGTVKPKAAQSAGKDRRAKGSTDGWSGRNLTRMAVEGELPPFVGREAELATILRVLVRTKRRHVAILGKPGIGKTALAHGVALALASNKAPAGLGGMEVIEFCGTEFGADFDSEAELSRRLKSLVAAVQRSGSVILFIEDFHGLFPSHLRGGSALALFKRALDEGEMPCIVATTSEQWERVTGSEPSLRRLFQVICLEDPSVSDTRGIAEAWASRISVAQKIRFTKEAIEAVLRAAQTLRSERAIPDRIVDILESAATLRKVSVFSSGSKDAEIKAEDIQKVLRENYGVSAKEPPKSISEM